MLDDKATDTLIMCNTYCISTATVVTPAHLTVALCLRVYCLSY